MKRKRIAIVAGGDSGEYEVSIKSAAIVEQYLDKEAYEPFLIVMKNNSWTYRMDDGKEYAVQREDFSLDLPGGKITFDVVFVAIHGTPGEDGKLQGYLDILGIPYTTCGHDVSALTFNKNLCSLTVSAMGVTIAPSVLLYAGQAYDPAKILITTALPCFVKPNSGGSSVGMTKVTEEAMLAGAIEKAFLEDDQVLVESFIPGREITCGVLTDRGVVRSLPVTEIIPRNEFFDYEAKYTDGMAAEITPAEIPDEIAEKCRSLSEDLYKKLNCKGFVRFDYIYNEKGMFFLEVNTVPGLSPNSILPQQAEADGISLTQLFGMALEQALNE